MGVFGAPFAHGDDAERAVRAALVIRGCVGELAGGDLQIRVAVNTGEAVVSLGARPALGESMVAGDVVNTAARLQAAAPVNGVVVGEETYRETRDAIEYEPTEPVVAKGKEHPVQAWVAVEPRDEGGRAAARDLGDRRPGGRAGDSARVLGARDARAAAPSRLDLRAGRGRQVDARRRVRAGRGEDGEARVVRGRSLPYRESGAYGSLATQLMQLAGVFESDATEVVSREAARAVRGAARAARRRPGSSPRISA